MIKLNENSKTGIKIFIAILIFYLSIMFAWSKTSSVNKPSSSFYDWRKEGYKENPLHDRKSDTLLDLEN